MDNTIFVFAFVLVMIIITIILYFYTKNKKGKPIANKKLTLAISYTISVLFIYFILRKVFDIDSINPIMPMVVAIPFYYLSYKR
ncbi:hypothetical protein [Sedimentibacter hydroxybenzoicus]|nr:hypothetical protein [Sedimentibacter hydroxybenzoicus]